MTPTAAPPSASAPALRSAGDAQLTPLFRRLRMGDGAAREALFKHYLPLARKLARRYARSSEPYEDLAQVASLALLKAIDRFDSERGSSFPAFAIPTILGDLRRYFRDCAWSVHVPRGAQERALTVAEAVDGLINRYGSAPTAQQLASYLEWSLEDVLDGLYAGQAYDTQPLDAPSRGAEHRNGTGNVRETLGAEDERYEWIEADVSAAQALRSLQERDRQILRLRVVEEMTQGEIATQMGISQMQISRLLRRSLERLQEEAGAAA